MKLIKVTVCGGKPMYINPLNINSIGNYEKNGLLKAFVEMIGCDDEHFYTVDQSLEEVVNLVEECDIT